MPNALQKTMVLARVDLSPGHRPPSPARWALAAVVSLAGSLLADAAVVAVGQAVFPSTKGYVHFQFSDYAKLTVIGVIIACVAWPVVTYITSSPRWMFFRMAVVVTLVLMLMHLAIALVTYNCLVHLAPTRRRVVEGPG